jgi:sigma-B regulation protein RsbU (phosphoserine phosphatase)
LLILYTDGVTEAQDAMREEYGETRLLDVVANGQQNGRSTLNIATHILSDIKQFAGDVPQFDDITLMVLKRIGS